MSDTLKALLDFGTVAFAVTLAGFLVAFLAKTWFTAWVTEAIRHNNAQQLEQMKLKWQAEENAKLERHKAELTRENAEHGTRFSQLQAKIAESIGEVSAAIRLCKLAFDHFTNPLMTYPEDVQKEVAGRFLSALEDCQKTTLSRLIFFNKETADRLEELVKNFWLLAMQDRTSRGATDPQLQANVRSKIENDLPALLGVVEQKFRDALGHLKEEAIRR